MPMGHIMREGPLNPVMNADFEAPAETAILVEGWNCWYQHVCPRHGYHNAGGLITQYNGKDCIWGALGELTDPRKVSRLTFRPWCSASSSEASVGPKSW